MKTSTKLMLIAMLALAVGGTCPSDVDNDGTVGINDFLQLLGDWGPCPSPPKVVAMDGQGSVGPMFRVWSDGTIQFLMFELDIARTCFECELSTPVLTWLDMGTTPASNPVDIRVTNPNVAVTFADGSTWYRLYDFDSVVDPVCADAPNNSFCTFVWLSDWIEFG